MNVIKEFLKPNWWKIGIVIILFIVSIYLLPSPENICPRPEQPRTPEGGIIIRDYHPRAPIWDCPDNPITILSLFLRPLITTLGPSGEPLSSALVLVLLFFRFIYLYLLACLIYFILSKIRNLKK